MSIKNLVELIKHNGLLASMDQLEKLYQVAIENEQKLAELEAHLAALAAENAGLKSNLMYWDNEDSEPARSPLDIAHESSFGEGVEFDVQVAARMPSMTYRVVRRTTYSTEIELVMGGIPDTPATDAFMAEVRASAIEHAASERWGSGYVFDELNEFAAQLRKGVQS